MQDKGTSAHKDALNRAITKKQIFTSPAQTAQKYQNFAIILQFIPDVGSRTREK
ncbi:hypothetical protein IV66_GL001837 [Ligilactobacillus pobuzihii]|uniref:Uncharacterized protein n=1 Tax=Ligilactobacillus pobuzihii TaxID=449659 RepID=A0A0R2LGS6_9LACO|nr:hypothetical protein IV66_GL001837 [Ligilactobacillus pobuzihii]